MRQKWTSAKKEKRYISWFMREKEEEEEQGERGWEGIWKPQEISTCSKEVRDIKTSTTGKERTFSPPTNLLEHSSAWEEEAIISFGRLITLAQAIPRVDLRLYSSYFTSNSHFLIVTCVILWVGGWAENGMLLSEMKYTYLSKGHVFC